MVRVAKQDESVSEIVARVHAEAVAAAEKVPRVDTNMIILGVYLWLLEVLADSFCVSCLATEVMDDEG